MTPRRASRRRPAPQLSERATYTVEEAAAILGIGTSTMYDAIRAGHPPVPVIEVTGLGLQRKAWRVPVQPLREALGLT